MFLPSEGTQSRIQKLGETAGGRNTTENQRIKQQRLCGKHPYSSFLVVAASFDALLFIRLKGPTVQSMMYI